MYRIKLGSGDESVFNSIEELSFGIGTGIIGQDAQIYHDTAEKWLPVTVHPAYKKAAASAPPPAPDHTARPAGNGNSAQAHQSEAAPLAAEDDGQDLMTLLNLDELAEFNPRKVQESAATQDPAEPAESQVAPAGELPQEPEPPESADLSDMVELPADHGDVTHASKDEVEEDYSTPSLEFLAVPEDDESEEPEAKVVAEAQGSEVDETVVDGFESTTLDNEASESDMAGASEEPTDLSDILDDSADADDMATQALDSVMEVPAAKVPDESKVGAGEILEEHHDHQEKDDEPVEATAEEPVDTEEDPEEADDPESESVEVESVLEEAQAAWADKGDQDTESSVGIEATRSFGDAWSEPPETNEAEPAEDEDEAADGQLVDVGAAEAAKDDPIAAFDPDADVAFEAQPTVLATRPGASRKPLIAVAIATGIIIVAGLAWVLKGTSSAQDGDDPASAQTPVAAAGPVIPTPAPAATVDSTAGDSTIGVGSQQRYEEAYARAQIRFDDALRRAGFVRVFAATRFSSASEMSTIRGAVQNARRALGDYSVREGGIENGYTGVNPSLRETRANRELAEDLLALADSVYGLLLNNPESFALRAGALTFTNDVIEAEYTWLRDEVDRLVVLASNVEDGTQSASITRMAAGIGTTRPLPLSTLAPAPVIPEDISPGG